MLLDPVVAVFHDGAESGGRGIKDVDLVLFDDVPEPVRLGIVGYAFKHDAGSALGQRAVNDVAVTGNPADIGRAPVSIFILIIEDPFESGHDVEQVAGGGVQNALGLAGAAAGVEDEQRIFSIHFLGLAGFLDIVLRHLVIPATSRPAVIGALLLARLTTICFLHFGQDCRAWSALALLLTTLPAR